MIKRQMVLSLCFLQYLKLVIIESSTDFSAQKKFSKDFFIFEICRRYD